MRRLIPCLLALFTIACEPPHPAPTPEDIAAFRTAFATSRADLHALEVCFGDPSQPMDSLREIEKQRAVLASLAIMAEDAGLPREDYEPGERGAAQGCPRGFDETLRRFVLRASRTAQTIENVQ